MFNKYNLPALIWVLVILFLTLAPGDAFPVTPKFLDLFQPDKIVHLIMFSTLVVLLINAFDKQSKYPSFKKHYILIALLISIFLGGITEVLQGIMDIGRTASIYDFIANAIGSFLGYYIYTILRKRGVKYFS